MARRVALSALTAFRRYGAWADGYLKKAVSDAKLSHIDAALASNITYGVLQNMTLIDYYLQHISTLPLKKLNPRILDILRIAAYQIVFLDRIPHCAAVNEAVKAARRDNPRAAAFTNAVLRKLSLTADNLPEPPSLAVKYSHPEWLTRRFVQLFGATDAEKLLAENNTVPKMYARVNTILTTPEKLLSELCADGIKARLCDRLENSLEIDGMSDISGNTAFCEGKFIIQDISSQLVALSAGAKSGMAVLDACAAPGGKSFVIAQCMNDDGRVIACDIHEKKLAIMRESAKRLKIHCVETRLADAAAFLPEFNEKFDVVIADVPCSGLGIIRKKPDIRYKSEADIAELPSLQLKILKNVSRYVKAGGTLIYSTCTILPEENSGVVGAFLSDADEFESLEEKTFLPYIDNTDGFYYSKLRRRI